ncbi:AraC family transcriptional regulator [Paenibacillus antri]|uniref:AraC family transcriptional regulator n=1 Tax=Paenibacillus antri TaxID=2582848 RepID=A0A5R9G7E6_9BACL|nr:helix-turn-helix domain-containing protein [Paenibacillus antri]TLS48944.1 AraC family transcriptional regulator [Paenibacillus antri]
MNMLSGVTNRKYLQRILFYFNLSMVGLLLFTSISFYAYSKEIVLQTQREADRKVLSQIKHNLSYIEELVQNVAIMVNLDPGIVYLMNADAPEPVMKFQTLRKLDMVTEATTFVDSIVVAGGGSLHMYFGGSGLWTRTHMPELQESLRKRLESIRPEEIGRLVPVRIDEEGTGVDVFSFILVGNRPADGAVPSAVVVNVRPQWIFENVSNVNTLSEASNMILVDRNGTILHSGEEPSRSDRDIESYVSRTVREGGMEAAEDFSVQRIGDRSYVISQMSVGVGEWRVMNFLPYDEVMSRVQKLRDLTMLVTSAFLVVSFALSLFVANRLYRPIRKLLELFRNEDGKPSAKAPHDERDEMAFLTDAYRHTLDRLEQVDREDVKTKRIVEDYYLRSWIADSAARSEEEFRLCAETNPSLFEGGDDGVWRLVVLTMDQSPSALEASDGFREKLFRFAVCNILEELLSRSYAARVIDMNNEFIVALLRSTADAVDVDVVSKHVRDAQETFRQYYRRTFSAAVGEGIARRTALTEAYDATVHQLMYRLAFGPGALITPELALGNRSRDDATLPRALEKSLVEGLRSKDEAGVRDALRRAFEWIAGLHYDYMTFAAQQLVLAVKPVLREPAFAAHANAAESQKLNRKVLQADSLAAMREELETFLTSLCKTDADSPKEERGQLIVDAVKEIIEKNLTDITLSLQSIATSLKMSPAYVGRVFRQYENMSVGDYLTGYRLEKARELLSNSDYTVKEIADYLGFSNASYFITLFKKKYGTTPKDFRVNAALGK